METVCSFCGPWDYPGGQEGKLEEQVLNLSEVSKLIGRFYLRSQACDTDTQHKEQCSCRMHASVHHLSLTCCRLCHCIFRVPFNYMHLPTCKLRAALITIRDLLNATQEVHITVILQPQDHPFFLHLQHELNRLSLPVS